MLEGLLDLTNVLEVAAAWKVTEGYGVKSERGSGLCVKKALEKQKNKMC